MDNNNVKTKKERLDLIIAIAERADNMGMLMFNRMSLIMDLEHTDNEFNLRLEELLSSNEPNFAHDIIGIQNNFNRKTLKMENCFLPRFSSNGN